MEWAEVKARLLTSGPYYVIGVLPGEWTIATSTAGPGAGGGGSVFLRVGERRVRLGLSPHGKGKIIHRGGGHVRVLSGGADVEGVLEPVGYHCPGQAFITVSGSCIFSCRYCPVPTMAGRRKSPEEVLGMVEAVRERVSAISLTSGVVGSVRGEEEYVTGIVHDLVPLGLPVGVSIYPAATTPERLAEAGVREVKFNLEAATPRLFKEMCPGLEEGHIRDVLSKSVDIFGSDHVHSNVIAGLGESDAEMTRCIQSLTNEGIIPVIRPLTPAGTLADWPRPSPQRLVALAAIHRDALRDAGLDPRRAMTMCCTCTGCDIVPGRDL